MIEFTEMQRQAIQKGEAVTVSELDLEMSS